MLQSLKSMSRLYPLVSLWCPFGVLCFAFLSQDFLDICILTTHMNPLFTKSYAPCLILWVEIRNTVIAKNLCNFLEFLFFCICFPRKVSNIWDSICLVFPLSAKNKASYVGKHWVENWLYSRSHREKKKKDTHCFYRHGCFLITTPRYTCYILLEVLKFNC